MMNAVILCIGLFIGFWVGAIVLWLLLILVNGWLDPKR